MEIHEHTYVAFYAQQCDCDVGTYMDARCLKQSFNGASLAQLLIYAPLFK